MLKKELAELLGISPAMVTKLAKIGMPTDTVEKAKRWRKLRLDPGRVKGVRFDPNKKPGPTFAPHAGDDMTAVKPAHVKDQIQRCIEEIKRTLRFGGLEDISALNIVEWRLQKNMREIAEVNTADVRLPVTVWGALTEQYASNRFPDDLANACHLECGALLTVADFADAVRPWIDLAPSQWWHVASGRSTDGAATAF